MKKILIYVIIFAAGVFVGKQGMLDGLMSKIGIGPKKQLPGGGLIKDPVNKI